MKLTCKWDPEDIQVGRFYYKNQSQTPINSNPRYFLSTLYKIGYDQNRADSDLYVSIAMTDGMVISGRTKEDLAKALTDGDYIPCTGADLAQVLAHCANVYGDKFNDN